MSLTQNEWWGLIHGMALGGVFLVALIGGVSALYGLKPELLTTVGITQRIRRLRLGVVGMATAAWLAVITGTWIVYPVYREKTDTSPRSQLLASPDTEQWHKFGMEWKEHVAWIGPMLATAVAFIVIYYGKALVNYPRVRRAAMILFILAFVFTAVAGGFGALITKIAPVR